MPKYPGFVGPSYTAQNPIAANDEVYNWYPSKVESGTGPAEYVFDPAPGFSLYCTLGSSPTRGGLTLNGASFQVADETAYQLPFTSGGSATTLATGLNNPDDSLVTMAGNGDAGRQLAITSGSKLYCLDLQTSTLTTIPDISATFVVFADGYFIALDPNTSTFYLSALEDGSLYDLGDAVQRNDQADKWMAATVSHKELWLLGSQTTSVYYNSGQADTPWIPNPSVQIPRGVSAPNSVATLAGSPIWLADDFTVRYAQGYTPARVSSGAMEYQIAQYASVADADGDTYEEQGHQFYQLNFPTANVTWTYDLTTGLWHKRGPWNGLDFSVSPVRGFTQQNGVILTGSRTTGAIYQQSVGVATDTDGVSGLRRMRRAPHVASELNRIRYARLLLHMQTGVGLISGQGADPTLMLRCSDDGGQSFGNIQTVSAGVLGDYSARPFWTRLGIARDRVFEVTASDPVPWRLVDAYLDFSVGAS